MTTRRAAVVVVVGGAVLATLTAGCGRKHAKVAAAANDAGPGAATSEPRAELVVLDTVEVELHGRAEQVIDPRALGRSIARCLIESGAPVAALASQAPPGRVTRHLALTVVVTVHEPNDDRPVLGVTLDAMGRWADDGLAAAPTASLTGAATPRPPGTTKTDPVEAATAAVVLDLEPRVCAELSARITTWGADDLAPALAATDPGQVRWALPVAVDRPPADEPATRAKLIDAIAPHLGGDPPVRDAAIAALVATHDPRAVAPLTSITDVGDEAALVRIIQAVARLGGDDARDYLQVMTSHRDHAVARAARTALDALTTGQTSIE